MDYDVLWNGSKDHPGGRQLFADEHAPIVTPDPPRFRRPSSLTHADRQRVIADVLTFGCLQAARLNRLTVEAVQHLVAEHEKGRQS